MGSQGVMLRERDGRERDGGNNEQREKGVKRLAMDFLGKTSFQWRLQSSINIDSVTRRLEENVDVMRGC